MRCGENKQINNLQNMINHKLLHAAHDCQFRIKYPWLSDFLGKDYEIAWDTSDYNKRDVVRLSSKDEKLTFIGHADRYGYLEYEDYSAIQRALDNAAKNAFKEFAKTLLGSFY
jgi:hypothetical protein